MKKLSLLFSIAIIALLTACKKEKIAPANQGDAFVKYYGHIRDQKASDVKPTADGGYLLLGASNSFSATSDDDFFLIKTDSFGNEEWSKSFGDGEGGFDEEGVSIVVLANDEGYLIAGNRTKMVLVGGQSRPDETNIVLYKLDPAGVIVWEKVLRPNVTGITKTDWVKDVKQTPDGGFILIGETSKVNTTKNEYTLYSAYDEQDILVLKMDLDANIQWESIRGFVGYDYGVSVELIDGDYFIVGTSDIRIAGNPSAPVFQKKILFARLKGNTGNEISYQNYPDETDRFVTAAYSCYDSISFQTIIVAHVEDLPSITDPREGDLMVLRIPDNNLNGAEINYFGKTSGGIIGIDQNIKAGSISLVPPQVQGDGFSYVITGTHGVGNGGSECMLLKINPDFTIAWDGNARFFGRPGENGNWLPGNDAKRVFPVEKLVAGTTRKELSGYAFTGTFNLGTNNMIGLIKTNAEGTMTPVE